MILSVLILCHSFFIDRYLLKQENDTVYMSIEKY